MSGEVIVLLGTTRQLEVSGTGIPNNAVGVADDATYSIFDHGNGYPHAKFTLGFMFDSAPVEGAELALFAQSLDIMGTADAETPEMTRPTVDLGSFIVNNVTTFQVAELLVENVPWNARYFIGNRGTGQPLTLGWSLCVTPCTDAPAA